MRLSLLTKTLVLLISFFIHGCAQTALDLPPDYGSKNSNIHLDESNFTNADLAITCPQIDEELIELRNQRAAIRTQIVASRESDQTIGYWSSVLFSPLWLAIDNDEDNKDLINRVQERIDTLIGLSRLKSCKRKPLRSDVASEFGQELQQLVELQEKGVISSDEFLELRSRTFNKYYPQN